MTYLITKLFVEQPLASPGSANNDGRLVSLLGYCLADPLALIVVCRISTGRAEIRWARKTGLTFVPIKGFAYFAWAMTFSLNYMRGVQELLDIRPVQVFETPYCPGVPARYHCQELHRPLWKGANISGKLMGIF